MRLLSRKFSQVNRVVAKSYSGEFEFLFVDKFIGFSPSRLFGRMCTNAWMIPFLEIRESLVSDSL